MSSIKRVNVEKRLSDMAVYNGVAYLAGQVPDTPTLDIVGQTKEVLATIDRLLAEAGTDKSRILMAQSAPADEDTQAEADELDADASIGLVVCMRAWSAIPSGQHHCAQHWCRWACH